ncbi:MAG: NADH:ubiquinone oxidoreductase [Candidatus Cloacimonetes bacterium]|nr:NADH:ubiquinone oxidoreductase [Candidatus Cloacimonadota bacterium]
MLDLIKARIKHGYQAVPNIRKAVMPENFPGFPLLSEAPDKVWSELEALCPVKAIKEQTLDLGRCSFCGECQRVFPEVIAFSNFHKTSTTEREQLVLKVGNSVEKYYQEAIMEDKTISKVLGRSFRLRSVSAGGCAACEMELNASNNVNFDMGRFGLEMVASPRHADGLIVTGPVSANMAFALKKTWEAIPEPKILILAGSCAISGGIFAEAPGLDRSWLADVNAALYIPGCPIHPLTIINGILKLLGRE